MIKFLDIFKKTNNKPDNKLQTIFVEKLVAGAQLCENPLDFFIVIETCIKSIMKENDTAAKWAYINLKELEKSEILFYNKIPDAWSVDLMGFGLMSLVSHGLGLGIKPVSITLNEKEIDIKYEPMEKYYTGCNLKKPLPLIDPNKMKETSQELIKDMNNLMGAKDDVQTGA